MHHKRILLASGILLLGTLASVPVAEATTTCDGFNNGIEDFSAYADFSHPAPTCLYTNNTNGGYVQPTIGGHDKVFFTGGSSNAGFLIAGSSPCAIANSGVPITVEADLYFTASAGAGDIKGLSWGDTSAGGTSANLGINAGTNTPYLTGHVSGTTDQAALPGAPALSLNTWYHFKLTVQDNGATSSCNSLTITGQVTVSGSTYGRITTASLAGTDIGTGLTNGGLVRPGTYNAGGGTFTSTSDLYVDNLQVSGYTTLSSGVLFCANPAEHDASGTGDNPNYGYTYRRGGSYFDQGEGDNPGSVGLSTGFGFSGASAESGWDYSAKGLTTSTRAAHVNITIEASVSAGDGGTDLGANSVFRTAFGMNSGAIPSSTTKGNGLNTQNFADHLEAQFYETDSDVWQVSLWYASPTVNGGARTQLGASANYGHSEDATDFTVWLDTRSIATGPEDAGFGSSGGTITTGPYLAVTVPVTTAGGDSNTILRYQSLIGVGSNVFLNDAIYDFWHVGYGDSLLTAVTAVDNNEQTGDEARHDSTCIFDDEGTGAVLGSSGTLPGSSLPDAPDGGEDEPECSSALVCTNSSNIPEGFTIGTFNALLGLFLIAGISGGAYFTLGRSAVVAGGFAVLGLIIAVVLGLIDLWVVIVLVVIGAAVVFVGVKKGAGG